MSSTPPLVLDDLSPLWSTSPLGTMISTSLRLRVISVDCYSATPPIIQHWRPKLAYRGYKTTLLFMYDLTAVDVLGKQVILLISPFHDDTAALLHGATILVTKLIKLKLEDLDKFYLVLADYTLDPTPNTFELKFRGELSLPGYVSLDKPLCCPFAKAVCPWTRLAVLWNIETIKTYDSLNSLPTHFSAIVNFINSGSFSLKKLDESFVNMLQGSSKRPLALRILAKSKERIFMNQTNLKRPIGAMTTLLVADNSGHCKVVVWDDAVGHMHKKVVEGDILVLAGKYSVGRYKSQNPSKYNLEPKSRNIHLSPVKVEIKLNVSDMSHVCILDSGANLPLPKPEWNFVAVDDLRRNKVLGSRLLDLCGVVLYLGRWERERCYDRAVPTGQYWVRVWLTVFDHTSMDADNTRSIPVKMFLDSERWDPMSSLVPGCPVVMTNLMFIQTEGVSSHLECTNETQVFVDDEALSSRFSENKVYQEFRETWNDKEEDVKNVVNSLASFGGQAHFGAKVLVTFRTGSFKSLQLADIMRNLVFRASARVLVRGTVGLLVDKSVDKNGKVEEESVKELMDLKGMSSVGDSDPNLDSFERRVEGLSRDQLEKAVESACLFVGDIKDASSKMIENHFATVGIVEGSTVIYCLCTSKKVMEELTNLGSEPASFCLDIVKISKLTSGDSAELVIRSALPIQKEEAANESSVSSIDHNRTTENTLDFLEPWNDN